MGSVGPGVPYAPVAATRATKSCKWQQLLLLLLLLLLDSSKNNDLALDLATWLSASPFVYASSNSLVFGSGSMTFSLDLNRDSPHLPLVAATLAHCATRHQSSPQFRDGPGAPPWPIVLGNQSMDSRRSTRTVENKKKKTTSRMMTTRTTST
ncbi:uncharacterized protein Dana_GF27670 [Drosophila ananassae]|uniref:Uncharacterized protein n=1 Tax=Drosophila ananassae TaxID=7217 RepID=A0A0P8XFP7_DROAN|nr:uncharacterized protein Dana_GF27670 [Drosophila ananassae]